MSRRAPSNSKRVGPSPSAKAGKKEKPPVPKSGVKPPAWWVFTTAASEFVRAARELAEALTEQFGEGVSISHFERAIGEIPSLNAEQRSLLAIGEDLLQLFEVYLEKKRARDAEREGFRSLVSVGTIEASLVKAKASLVESPVPVEES
jgi:hypothetical protein